MISERDARPEQSSLSEGMFWTFTEELRPIFEREGVKLRLRPRPDDVIEDWSPLP